jgi:hypothetical protein
MLVVRNFLLSDGDNDLNLLLEMFESMDQFLAFLDELRNLLIVHFQF